MTFNSGTAAGPTTIGSVPLSGGTAVFSTSSLLAGIDAISVSYSGDSNDNASNSSVLSQIVNKANTTISLTSTPNPAVVTQTVSLTACGLPSVTSGTVTFLDGTATLATNTRIYGPCSTLGANLTVGTHAITAIYSGDNNYGGSSSATVTQTVTAH